MRKPEELARIVEIFDQGWSAMEWLARHAKTSQCRECANYHRRVEQGGKPRDLVRLRCNLAQLNHRDYMAVVRMRLELKDAMECALKDGQVPCHGPAEWILARRKPTGRKAGQERRRGALIEYEIGCKRHVEKAEARAVIEGDASTVSIERLDGLSPDEAKLMT